MLSYSYVKIFVTCLGLGLGVESFLANGFSLGCGEVLPDLNGFEADRDCITLCFSTRAAIVLYLLTGDMTLSILLLVRCGGGGLAGRDDFVSWKSKRSTDLDRLCVADADLITGRSSGLFSEVCNMIRRYSKILNQLQYCS